MVKDSFKIDGVTYIRVEMPCPIDEVYNGHNSHLWQHAGCGGDMYLGDNATFYCSKCNESIPCILAKFECPYHSNSGVGYFISKSVGKSSCRLSYYGMPYDDRWPISSLKKLYMLTKTNLTRWCLLIKTTF